MHACVHGVGASAVVAALALASTTGHSDDIVNGEASVGGAEVAGLAEARGCLHRHLPQHREVGFVSDDEPLVCMSWRS